MRKTHFAMFVVAVLLIGLQLGANRSTQRWEYARLRYGYVPPVEWSWTAPGVYADGRNLDELCKQLTIEVPKKKGNVFAVVDWAGSQGWELATLQTVESEGNTAAWFKRPK